MMPSKILTNPQFMARLEEIRKASKTKGPDWLLVRKEAAWNAAMSAGFPSQKDEDWKYTDLSPLLTLPVEPFRASEGQAARKALDKFFNPQDITVVITDGHLPEELPFIPAEAGGVILKKFSAVREQEFRDCLAPAFDQPQDIFSNLNTALADDGLWIHVPRQSRIQPVIHICHIINTPHSARLCCPRVMITAEPLAEAQILMSFLSATGAADCLTNALTDIAIGPGAQIALTMVQDEHHGNYHVHSTRVNQHKNSSFDSFALITGGHLTRNNLTLTLLGEGAQTVLKGLYLLKAAQHADNHITVNHIAPRGTSTQLYKGILNGESRAVFNGKIYVHPEAQETNAYQLNRNLLMGEDCRINTKPQLEIFADNVKCSHGATVGQMDDNELFYLQSRGIPRKAAVSMLAEGFVKELFSKNQDTVRDRLLSAVNPVIKTAVC
ncbi:MAG TPA: Fe-S cluster assembly protein SufD [Candidatus Omnitrophota bacterium]|nr:Fe-S cluster assembly protein SufD [Candidatus Omnitrophota bacterium]HQO58929.1 Fe-S cluster assembly protein SufD [Candidatus Omnitrophota bacterium]